MRTYGRKGWGVKGDEGRGRKDEFAEEGRSKGKKVRLEGNEEMRKEGVTGGINEEKRKHKKWR